MWSCYVSFAVGAETEDAQIELLLKEVKGKDLAELIAAGREKLASVPSGGGGGVAVSSAPSAGGGGGGGAPAAEAKKEEKKEEKEESDDVSFLLSFLTYLKMKNGGSLTCVLFLQDMGFSLFE